jgi:hypothetical protein
MHVITSHPRASPPSHKNFIKSLIEFNSLNIQVGADTTRVEDMSIYGWGDAYLIGGETFGIQKIVEKYFEKLIPINILTGSLVDWLAWFCLEAEPSDETSPQVWVQDLLSDWYPPDESGGTLSDSLANAFDAFIWTRHIFPIMTIQSSWTSQGLSDMINGASLSRSHPWSVHRILEAAIKRRSVSDVVSILKNQSLPDPDRLHVYAFLLCGNYEEIVKDIGTCNFYNRFEDIVVYRKCGWQDIAQKFLNRILLSDWHKLLREMIRVIDPPVGEFFDTMTGPEFKVGSGLVESVFASSNVSDKDIVRLWDSLIISPPDVLLKVVAFAIVEVREYILACESRCELEDVLHCLGDLVEDFPAIINLALESHELVF